MKGLEWWGPRQWIFFVIYVVIGFPMIIAAPIWIGTRRYIFGDKEYTKPENRGVMLLESASVMVAFTLFFGAYALLLYYCR